MKYLPFFLLAIFIFSCGNTENASKTVDAYFDALKVKDYQTILTLYSDDFYQHTSREESLEFLQVLNETLGDLVSYEQVHWNSSSFAGTNCIIHKIKFEYKVEYSKHSSNEIIYFQSDNDNYLINGHRINSDAFTE